MTSSPSHVVVDGSNLATEGRSLPSLKQLSEAVMSFMEEHPDAAVTVVVDATFGHRIDKKEVKEFEEGIANNELVAPPAGAIGRGDAFVLSIADKANATVLSNDSFQEFHADYDWLFDDGRLIGGKPVPHVGWVWVARTPVRGPVSRKVTRDASRGGSRRGRGRKSEGQVRQGSPEASKPMPVPKGPPPRAKAAASRDSADAGSAQGSSRRAAPSGGEPVNELLPFLDFVEHHPVGTSINGTVDSYSSHGAYITIGDDGVRGYIPLRMMADPTPRSAKSIIKIGESVTAVVVSFSGARRSIDCALPDMAERAIAEASAAAADGDEEITITAEPARKRSAAKKSPAKKTAAKKTATKKAPAKKAPAKKTAAKKSAAKKSPAKRAPAKKTAAKKTSAKKTAAKKAPAKKTAAKKAPAKKSAAKKSPAKKAPAKKTAAKKSGSTVQRVPATPTPVKQSAAKRTDQAAD